MNAGLAAAICMIVVNRGPAPVELHGCVPFVSDDGNYVGDCLAPDDDGWLPPFVLTVPGYHHQVIFDAEWLSYRLWDDPKSVDIHWRLPCPPASELAKLWK